MEILQKDKLIGNKKKPFNLFIFYFPNKLNRFREQFNRKLGNFGVLKSNSHPIGSNEPGSLAQSGNQSDISICTINPMQLHLTL